MKPARDKNGYTSSKRQAIMMSAFLIVILGFAVYGNSLGGRFVWDDEYLVEKNVYIKSWSHLPDLFTTNIGKGGGMNYFAYRPIQMLTYMVDHSLWRLNAAGYHFTNVLLHVLVALGIYRLLRILFDNNPLSLLTAVLFLVAPVHTSAVAYVSGRADSLAFLFMILSVILYIKVLDKKNVSSYFFMIAAYMLALLSRENSLILPALLLVYHFTFDKKVQFKYFTPFAGLALVYILLRLSALRHLLPHVGCPTTLIQRVPGIFAAITGYVRLVLFPSDLHMEYGHRLFAFYDPRVLIGTAILFLSVACAFKKRRSGRIIFFSVAWFFTALLPVSNIYPVGFYMTEHWLYVPSVGAFLLLASAIVRIYEKRKLRTAALALMIFVAGFYSYSTIRHNRNWKDPITFYEWTLRYAPSSSRTYDNLGRAYKDAGRIEDAIAAHKKAIAIDPNFTKAYNNLGVAYKTIGNKQEAERAYKKAIAIDPGFVSAYNNLAGLYRHTGRVKEAIAWYNKALALDSPLSGLVHFNLSMLYYADEKRFDLAVKHCDLAVELGYDVPHYYLEMLKPHRKQMFGE